jgi:phosphate transport system substrate-binding protein
MLLVQITIVTACTATPTPRPSVTITLVGEDSMQWLAQSLGDAFRRLRPEVAFVLHLANSAEALRAPSEDPRTIGLIGRTVKPAELHGTRVVVVARDGVAIIVNQKNPINAILSSQIPQVFSGEILTWPTGPYVGESIAVVSREEGSGTRSAFEAMAMRDRRVTLTAVVMPGEAAAVDYVARHADAIGYASMGMLNSDVRALAVDQVLLSPQTVESQKYPFVRTLAFVLPLEPDPNVQAFVDFVLSPDGQATVSQRYARAPLPQ